MKDKIKDTTTEKRYKCKICKNSFFSKKEQKKCEEKGVPEVYPDYLIFTSYCNNLNIILEQIVNTKKSPSPHVRQGFGYSLSEDVVNDIVDEELTSRNNITIPKLNKKNKVDIKSDNFKLAAKIVGEIRKYTNNPRVVKYWDGKKVAEYKLKKERGIEI